MIQKINLEGKVYNLGYKVVTSNLRSLGLRKNPNIIAFPVDEWYFLPEEMIEKGKGDFGGIWVARAISGARMLKKYMKEKYDTKTRIFKAALWEVLYFNNYRIKTSGLRMFEEICEK